MTQRYFTVILIIMLAALPVCSQGIEAKAENATPDSAKVSRVLSYSEAEVRIEGGSPGILLTGTLTLPEGSGPHPSVILIAGNGPHTRDQMISGTPVFRVIADHLVRKGIAVLRYDKRGMGSSTGPKNEEDSTTEEFAADARACFNFLKKRPEIDPKKIGLIGHSEGAMIAPMVANSESGVCFVVLIAPPAAPCEEIWIKQRLNNLKRLGADPAVLPAVETQLHRLVEFVVSGKNDDETYYRIGHDFVAAHGMPEERITKELIDQLISDWRHRWYRFFFSYKPADALKRLNMPLLAVMASEDTNVLLEQNLPPMIDALVEAKNPDFTVTVLPDQDHFFLVFKGRRLEKHNPGKMEVAPALLNTMAQWIRDHMN